MDPREAREPGSPENRARSKGMHDLLIIVLLVAGWVLLNTVILPRLGVST
jgi:hypothetical protein